MDEANLGFWHIEMDRFIALELQLWIRSGGRPLHSVAAGSFDRNSLYHDISIRRGSVVHHNHDLERLKAGSLR
jgi:hypothetical protein